MKLQFLFSFLFLFSFGNTQNVRDYIKEYKALAIDEMHRYNIPASITLAQGILESGSGSSKLAREANNHFGIKCHVNWTGGKSYHDDDLKQECFRKYNSVFDSFRDHSLFLSGRKRYSFLFDLRKTDYKSWAKGLQKAGYATNKTYAKSLINLIKEYDLSQYDKKRIKKQDVNQFVDYQSKIYEKNYTKYILAETGQFYDDIAEEYGLWLWELLRYNESEFDRLLKTGEKVYLQPKRRQGIKNTHVVLEGETMYSISQMYGIKLKHLYKKNRMIFGTEPYIGQKLNLIKKIKFN